MCRAARGRRQVWALPPSLVAEFRRAVAVRAHGRAGFEVGGWVQQRSAQSFNVGSAEQRADR